MQRRVEALDPSRPTSFHDQCWGKYNNAGSTAAVGVYHYPGFNGAADCDKEKRPILFGEYAHIECYNRRELATDPGIRDDWGRPFETMVDNIQHHDGCLGGAIWAAIDDVFHLPGGQIVGYGPWGVIDGWRREKPEYWQVKNAYSPVRLADRHAALPAGATRLELALENRYNFTNLSECRIAWQLGSDHGTITADVPARAAGKLVIPLPRPTRPGEEFRLDITDPRGFVCESDALTVGTPDAAAPVNRSTAAAAPTLSQTGASIDITTATSVVHLQRATGAVTVTTRDGKPLVQSLGLMILPLNAATGGNGGKAGNDYQNNIEPFTPICGGWQLQSLDAREQDGRVVVELAGTYHEAVGKYTFTIAGDGQIELAYRFDVTKPLNPRQWGVVLDAPTAFDTLDWHRAAQWTVYPADHIARPAGTARANAAGRDGLEIPRQRPTASWSNDATRLGSNDFRSTKFHIDSATLTDGSGPGIAVRAEGPTSVRCWLEPNKVRMLIAGFHTGGADKFSAGLFASERRPLTPDKPTVQGKVLIAMPVLPAKHS